MRSASNRRTVLSLTAALGGAAIMLAAWWFPRLRPSSHLAAAWLVQAEQAPNREVPERVARLTLLGDAGLAALVTAMDHSRAEVAAEATSVLNAQMDRWQLLPARQSTPKVARLAKILADAGEVRSASAGEARRDVTMRILLWPIDRQVVDAATLVSNCEAVLRRPKIPADRADATREAGSAKPMLSPPLPRVADVTTVPIPAPAFPGGGLPLDVAEIPNLPRADMAPAEHSLVDATGGTEATPGPSRAPQTPIATAALSDPPAGNSPFTVAKADLPGPVAPHDPRVELPGLADIRVMERLASNDPRVVQAATAELQRRGFQSPELKLARQLVDPDPEVRLELVDALPQMPGIDARRWLLWLCRDRDPLVRKAAVTVVGTTNDPSIRGALLELERVESDPGVLQLVRSVLYPNRTR
jgi:hypothetical protein